MLERIGGRAGPAARKLLDTARYTQITVHVLNIDCGGRRQRFQIIPLKDKVKVGSSLIRIWQEPLCFTRQLAQSTGAACIDDGELWRPGLVPQKCAESNQLFIQNHLPAIISDLFLKFPVLTQVFFCGRDISGESLQLQLGMCKQVNF